MGKLLSIDGNLLSVRGNVMKIDARKPMHFKIDTTKGNGFPSFKIPTRVGNTYNFSYSVNDGPLVQITSYNQAETLINFPDGHGIYDIKIRGSVGSWYDNNTGDVQKYVELVSFGDVIIGDLTAMFYGAINLKFAGSVSNQLVIDGPNAPNAGSAYRFCKGSGVGYVPVKMLKRCPKILSLNEFYHQCLSLSAPLPLLMFADVPLCANFRESFRGCTSLTGSVPTLKYNSKIVTLEGFFYVTRNLAITLDMFDLTNIYKVTIWTNCMRVTATAYSHTGTLQPIWDYEFETATGKSSAFLNCTALTNYTILRANWP